MILDLNNIKNKYNLKIDGIIHIGAHFGYEYETYVSNDIENLIFFEPVPTTFNRLKSRLDGKALLVNTALGNTEGKIVMNIETANEGQSSSVLEPALHLQQYPYIKFENKLEVDITTLDNFMSRNENLPMINMINIDVQGYEMEVFKGAEKTLETIDYIITEVNRDNVYHNCTLVNDLDKFLSRYGFERVETDWVGDTWGDAFYIKRL